MKKAQRKASTAKELRLPPIIMPPYEGKISRSRIRELVATTKVEMPPHFDEIARLAQSYWNARGGKGGSLEEDWKRVEREVHQAMDK